MTVLMEAAKIYRIIEAKLQHSPVAVPPSEFKGMTELVGAKETQIRDCLRSLHARGLVVKVPYFGKSRHEKIAFQWAHPDGDLPGTIVALKKVTAAQAGIAVGPAKRKLDIRVNEDGSLGIMTKDFDITIRVPQ